ncbi:similar to CW7 [Actinidia rufa]|uniref:Similar to CW7 n=1 Tax=Actinidia rufa TaxID=165716 RepID=A0A7J0GHE0_9ERIC|nr:similar to CW7 [Actinidia rufa]
MDDLRVRNSNYAYCILSLFMYELLRRVKNHSKLLGKTIVEEGDASDVEMDREFWYDIMDLYFIRGRESRGRQDDDLVFFVSRMILHGYGFNDNVEGNSPYFVRRWAPKALRNHQTGLDTPLSSIYKEVETTPAYPDICFAVDDFDSTFDAVVLTDTDHCYCVLLNADGGAAFPSEMAVQDCTSSDISSLEIDTGPGKAKKTKLTLFSGFVSYQMVRDAYEAGKSGFGSLFSLGNSHGKTDRIYMKGPGGHGEVEVAVSGVIDQSKHGSGPSSPTSMTGFSFGTIVRKAASVASVAAKQAYATAAATRDGSDEEMLPLKCCLMSVSLPWDHIAHDLLFKVV